MENSEVKSGANTSSGNCRHEYVKIYQRKLKGLDRRLVATRAWLPVGFKQTDFGHLGEGSYCFCVTCRARLFPRRTQFEKAAARAALSQSKITADMSTVELLGPGLMEIDGASENSQETIDFSNGATPQDSVQEKTIHVEELELEAVDMQDIEAEGVKLTNDDSSTDLNEEDI